MSLGDKTALQWVLGFPIFVGMTSHQADGRICVCAIQPTLSLASRLANHDTPQCTWDNCPPPLSSRFCAGNCFFESSDEISLVGLRRLSGLREADHRTRGSARAASCCWPGQLGKWGKMADSRPRFTRPPSGILRPGSPRRKAQVSSEGLPMGDAERRQNDNV